MKRRMIAMMMGITMTAAMIGQTAAAASMMNTAAAASVTETDATAVQTDEASVQDDTAAGETEEEMNGVSGEAPSGERPEGMPGEPPSGERPEGTPGQPPADGMGGAPAEMGSASGEMDGASGEMGGASGEMGGAPGQMGSGAPGGMPGGGTGGVDSYDAVNTYSESAEISGEEIVSTGTDENAVLVDGADAEVTVKSSAVTRESSDSTGGDNSSFYGVGAAMLVTDGSLYVSDDTITTDAAGGAGVFAYGEGTAYVADSTISTEQNTSGGIHAAGGGTLYAWNLDVNTNGGSAAAIRSDRGGGTMVIDGGSYTSNGSGSPAIYCTADITVNEADLEATDSEAVCIEGLNTIRLFNCNLTGNMPDQEQNDTTWNVIVYQSMSGDSVEGNGTFEMSGGTLTAKNGGMFYTTNTESTITLQDVEITYAEDNLYFLKATGNSNARGWGNSGSNGADCLFTAISQEMEGDVIWDSISQLDFYMTNNSVLTGAFIDDETNAGEGGSGYAALYIDETSTWVVTGDSTLTALHNAGTITDANGDSVTIIGTDGTVYAEGTGNITVTVESYEETADTTGAGAVSVWEDYAVEKPEALA